MTSMSNTLISTAVAFVVTLVLNAALNYYSSDMGTVGISKPIVIDGKSVVVLSVENYSRNFIDDLAVEIPKTISVDRISTDSPVVFVDSAHGPSITRVVKINQISPRRVTRVLIPVEDQTIFGAIRVVNREAAGLALREDDELESPFRRAVLSASIAATLYALFWVASALHTNKVASGLRDQAGRLRDELEKLQQKSRDELEKSQQKNDEVRSEIRELKGRVTKQRILLLARLHDYAKELGFWRNSFKSLVLKSGGKDKRAEEIIEVITQGLGTQGTKDSGHEFETLKVASAWLADVEQRNKSRGPLGVGVSATVGKPNVGTGDDS